MLKTYQPANAKQNLDLEWPCFVITRPIYMLIMLGPFVRTQYFYTVKLYNINIHLYDYWVILGPIKLLCTAKSCTCIYNHLNYLMAIQLSLLKQLSTYCTTLWLKSFFLSPTGETGGDLWFALCMSVSQSVCHTFLDPGITFKLLHIFSWNLKHG
jgi:hypothetical protein